MKKQSEIDFKNRMEQYIDLEKITSRDELIMKLTKELNPKHSKANKQPTTRQIEILMPYTSSYPTTLIESGDYFFTIIKYSYGERQVKRDRYGRFTK